MKKLLSFGLILAAVVTLFAACGNKDEEKTYDYTAEQILDAIKEAYGESYLPDAEMNEAEFTETYGLNMDDVAEIKAEIAMISFNPDRVIVIKANEGKGEDVEKALTTARDNLVENGMWYPANLAKVNASTVLRQGDYVVYMMLGAVDENMDATEEQAAEFAKEQAEIGVNAFNALFE